MSLDLQVQQEERVWMEGVIIMGTQFHVMC